MEIYEPEEDSFLLKEQVEKFVRGRVLDMGTGSGIQALAAIEKKEVREVIAVDINEDALKKLKDLKKEKSLVKLNVHKSDLFQSVKGKFDTIIFNPPYLPNDESDHDAALDGGKIGDELLSRFLGDAKNHLDKKGFILLLFSNLTSGKPDEGAAAVLELIGKKGYSYEFLSKKSLAFFEELYVYRLTAKENERQIFAKGKRGVIYIDGKYCIKEKNPDASKDSLANEADFLQKLNKQKIGPKFVSFDGKLLKREFIKGVAIEEFIESANAKDILKVINDVLAQCRAMDGMKINKTELTNPYKDIIVDKKNKAFLIDFERCKFSTKPQNVNQFIQYIFKKRKFLSQKNISVDEKKIMQLSSKYKKSLSEKDFESILKCISMDGKSNSRKL
jgi:release factor glutamine methyltransferase